MRKAIVLLLTILSFAHVTLSQTARKTWYVGTNTSRNFEIFGNKLSGPKGRWSTLIELPVGGYFVANRLLVGIGTSIQIIPKHVLKVYPNGGVGHIYSVNPFVRYYLSNNIFKLFLQLQYKYGRQDSEMWGDFVSSTIDSRKTLQVFQGKLGASITLTKTWHLETGFYVDHTGDMNKVTNGFSGPISETTHHYDNLGFSLGVGYHFEKK